MKGKHLVTIFAPDQSRSLVIKSGQVWASLLCAIETKETTIHVNDLTIHLSTYEY